MNERMRFILMHEDESFTVSRLCELFGISRRTGCDGLRERSRAALSTLR